MATPSRRSFLKTTGALTAASVLPTMRVLGANDDIRIAIIGINGKGNQHIKQFSKLKGVRIVALCDADKKVLDSRVAGFTKQNKGATVDGYVDYRKALERDDVDAVVIATPNHWHSLLAIHACQAGKDVYVEKPVCHTIWEGQRLAEAAKKYNRIVQGGTQNRSDVGLREFYPWMAEGNIGKILSIRGMCYRNRTGIGKRDTPLTPPESVDYNLWLGPAQDLPMYRPKFHYDWHWIWNTGNGDIGNQGPHETNLISWAMGDKTVPNRVLSFGGRFGWEDGGETPNMLFSIFEWDGIPVFFETRDMRSAPDQRMMPHYKGIRNPAVIITCEGGEFRGGRGGGWLYDAEDKRVRQFKGDGGGGHQANFIEAVRSRKWESLHAPVDVNARSSCLAHIGNISYRLGSKAQPEELRERMADDKQALDGLERYSEQLAAWNIDYKKEPWTMGVSLEFDPDTLRFSGGNVDLDKANAMLHRKDREPFVVPETV